MIYMTMPALLVQSMIESNPKKELTKENLLSLWQLFKSTLNSQSRLLHSKADELILFAPVVESDLDYIDPLEEAKDSEEMIVLRFEQIYVSAARPQATKAAQCVFAFNLDLETFESDHQFEGRSAELKAKIKARELAGATIFYADGRRLELKKEEFFPLTLPELLVNEFKAKTAKSKRAVLRQKTNDSLEGELKALGVAPAAQLERAVGHIKVAGDSAQQDHIARSGWRWGGAVFNLFGRRDLAPLVHATSKFKQATEELATKYSSKK